MEVPPLASMLPRLAPLSVPAEPAPRDTPLPAEPEEPAPVEPAPDEEPDVPEDAPEVPDDELAPVEELPDAPVVESVSEPYAPEPPGEAPERCWLEPERGAPEFTPEPSEAPVPLLELPLLD